MKSTSTQATIRVAIAFTVALVIQVGIETSASANSQVRASKPVSSSINLYSVQGLAAEVSQKRRNANIDKAYIAAGIDQRLYEFSLKLRKRLGLKEGEVDDNTENFLKENKIILIVFGLCFCWLVIRSFILHRRK